MQAGSLRTFGGAVAIVTGGASGIGAALGRALVWGGATVVAADRQFGEEAVTGTVAPDASATDRVAVDVRDGDALEQLVAGVFARYGRLDYLFNNAGIGIGGEMLDVTADDWRYIVDVNLLGVVHGIRAAYGRMVRQGFGHIVNTASMAGWMATPMTTPYCATKHAVVGLSRSLRAEAQVYNVRVSVLCPGVIRTPLLVDAGRYGRTTMTAPAELQRSLWERLRPMNVDRFAEQALRAVARNRSIIIVPRWWQVIQWMNRLSPTLADVLGAAAYARVRPVLVATKRPATAPDGRRAA